YRKLQEQYASLFYQRFGTGQPSVEYPETMKLKELLKTPLASGFSPNTNDVPPGIPVFSLSAITKFGIDESQVKYYTGKNYQGRGSNLEVDDILISRSNTLELVGKVG